MLLKNKLLLLDGDKEAQTSARQSLPFCALSLSKSEHMVSESDPKKMVLGSGSLKKPGRNLLARGVSGRSTPVQRRKRASKVLESHQVRLARRLGGGKHKSSSHLFAGASSSLD